MPPLRMPSPSMPQWAADAGNWVRDNVSYVWNTYIFGVQDVRVVSPDLPTGWVGIQLPSMTTTTTTPSSTSTGQIIVRTRTDTIRMGQLSQTNSWTLNNPQLSFSNGDRYGIASSITFGRTIGTSGIGFNVSGSYGFDLGPLGVRLNDSTSGLGTSSASTTSTMGVRWRNQRIGQGFNIPLSPSKSARMFHYNQWSEGNVTTRVEQGLHMNMTPIYAVALVISAVYALKAALIAAGAGATGGTLGPAVPVLGAVGLGELDINPRELWDMFVEHLRSIGAAREDMESCQ